MSTDIQSVIQLLNQDAKLDLFELDLSPVTGTHTSDDTVLFHCGTNQLTQPVVWQGRTFQYIPASADGFDINTQGALPRPRMIISNVFSAISAVLEEIGGDMTGAKLIRHQTYARYLDAANYPARTSIMNWTEDISQWTLATGTCAVGATDARGDPKAVTYTELAASGAHTALINATPDFIIGQGVTAWAEVKPNGRNQVKMKFTGTAGVSGQITVDFSTSKVISATGINRYMFQPIGESGWWLMMINSTVPAAGKLALTIQGQLAGASTYLGEAGKGFIVGRTQVFLTQTPEDPTASPRDLMDRLPYQYVGAAFNAAPDADPNRYLPDETYFIERKVSEDEVQVEFEMSSAIDLENLQLPRRVITVDFCSWDDYRGPECSYAGTAKFDTNDQPTSDPTQDVCSRSVNGCKVRFGASNPLPYGGFPGAHAYKI